MLLSALTVSSSATHSTKINAAVQTDNPFNAGSSLALIRRFLPAFAALCVVINVSDCLVNTPRQTARPSAATVMLVGKCFSSVRIRGCKLLWFSYYSVAVLFCLPSPDAVNSTSVGMRTLTKTCII